jgi:asparagine synthase (glutamine-hydrolysing)
MCGIFAIFNQDKQNLLYQKKYDALIRHNFMKGKSRGPEKNTLLKKNGDYIGFHRLAINGFGNDESEQPLKKHNCILICNGEIYNWKHLGKISKSNCTTSSDCEIILDLYIKYGIKQTLQMLDGVFAFILYDQTKNQVFVARDTYGVRPLFMCYQEDHTSTSDKLTSLFFASEMKSINDICSFQENNRNHEMTINNPFIKNQFPPGHYVVFSSKLYNTYIHPVKYSQCNSFQTNISKDHFTLIRDSLINAVAKRVDNTDREIACLLSGGLDSSLIAGLVVYISKMRFNKPPSTIHTWSIGMTGSQDLKFAKNVADFLGTTHHSIELTEKDFLDAIPHVIYAIESDDTTTIRASVGNWLISKFIRENSNAKVIFNGDGSDEVTGGYLYFHAAPDAIEFDKECRRLLSDIHYYDVLRSDRCIASHGLEPRTPFLDRGFVQTYLSIPMEDRCHNIKNKCEKYLLRKAFSDMDIIPNEVLWRRKEAFSDGVSTSTKSWFEVIQEFAQTQNPMLSGLEAENKYYKDIYQKHYGNFKAVPYKWMPKFVEATDASARTLKFYKNEL